MCSLNDHSHPLANDIRGEGGGMRLLSCRNYVIKFVSVAVSSGRMQGHVP